MEPDDPRRAASRYQFKELSTVVVRGKSGKMRVFAPLVDGKPAGTAD